MAKKLDLTIVERVPFADGKELGSAGAYERLKLRAHYRVDPRHPANRDIVDIACAPVEADGLVHFSGDVAILKPIDMERSNRRLFFEFVNRGNTRLLMIANYATQANEPNTLQEAGDLLMMRRGYAMAWAGWQGDLYPGNGRVLLDVPVATDKGRRITGRIVTEFVVDAPNVFSLPLSGFISTRSHPTVSLDTREARLTRRRYTGSERIEIPHTAWQFARFAGLGNPSSHIIDEFRGNEQIVLPSATDIFLPEGFKPGWIYELSYTAADPLVLGLGHAAVRDLLSFLRHDTSADNPLAWGGRTVEKVYGWGRSQTGRAIRDFVYRGFNGDVDGKRVFDCLHAQVPGAGMLDFNRFGNMVVSSSREYEDHLNPSDRFPFTFGWTTDHLTGKRDAILKRPDTDPLFLQTHSASEYWVRRGSLVHTTTDGEDIELPENVRVYAWLSSQHFSDPSVKTPQRGIKLNFTNIVQTTVLFRATIDMMDRWASQGTPPPPSVVPRRSDGTLVSFEEWKRSFPAIPGVVLPRGPNRLEHLDYGPESERGILERPPKILDEGGYPLFVPAPNADGNDRGGIDAPMVGAPLGTYTGWNLRARPHGYGAMQQMYGSYIPFPDTADEREQTGDPRPSILERYGSAAGYVAAIEARARELVTEGFLLEEDVARVVAEAANWGRPLHEVHL